MHFNFSKDIYLHLRGHSPKAALQKSRGGLSRVQFLTFVLLAFALLGAAVPCRASTPGVEFEMWISSSSMLSAGSTNFDVQAESVGGVTLPAGAKGASATIVSGLPSGVTASWSVVSSNSTGVMWNLKLTGSSTAAASSSSLNISLTVAAAGSGKLYTVSQAIPLTVHLTSPTLTFAPALTHIPVKQGLTGTDVITIQGGGSFHGNVALSVSGLPAGVTGSWSSSSVALSSGTGSSTLTLSPSTSAVVNWFNFTVTASGDGLSVTKTVTLEVEPAVGVVVQISHPVITVDAGATSTLAVTATPVHGVKLESGAAGTQVAVVSGLPSGVTASWSSPTVSSSGAASWKLTLAAKSAASIGQYPIGLAVKITDSTTGTVYSTSPGFTLLVSLLAAVSAVNVGSTPGVAVTSTFMGLAHEWGDGQEIMGTSAKGINLIYRQLLKNLTAYGSAPVNIRIGGNSTDSSGQPNSTTALPFAQLFQAMGNHFELGVNLGSDSPSLAASQASAYVAQMPAASLDAIEIGNEPDFYNVNGLRSSSYTVDDYYDDFLTWKGKVLSIVSKDTKLMGASWGVTSTLSNFATFSSKFSPDLSLVSQHFYATNHQADPPSTFLLTSGAATSGLAQVTPAVVQSHADGMPFRIGELNSISAGGIAGISNTFSAALWSIDTMFHFANVGVDGVNWQTTSTDPYSAFRFTPTSSHGITTYKIAAITPLYYGLLFFQAATPDGARILPVKLATQANMTAWATVDKSGTTRVVVLNKEQHWSGNVAVDMPGYTEASIYRLTAPSYQATDGVTFAGQTFDGSTDGTIRGSESIDTIYGADGVFQVPVPTMSAALVVFEK